MKTLASDVEKLSFDSDSEVYNVPALPNNQSRSKLLQNWKEVVITGWAGELTISRYLRKWWCDGVPVIFNT
jgi:hypothetical protein